DSTLFPYATLFRSNGQEVLGLERRAADQAAVDVRLRKQRGRIVRLYTAAVKNPQPGSRFRILLGDASADAGMHLLRLLRAGGTAGAYGPYRLVSDDGLAKRLRSKLGKHRIHLLGNHRLGPVRLSLLQGLAHAQHGHDAVALGRREALGNQPVRLAVQLPPLRVANQRQAAAEIPQHGGRNFAGVGTFVLIRDVLGAQPQPAAGHYSGHLRQQHEAWTDRDLDSFEISHAGQHGLG